MKALLAVRTLKNLSGFLFISAVFFTSIVTTSALEKKIQSPKEVIKVRLGEVSKVNPSSNTFLLKLASSTITITYDSQTLILSGDETVLSLEESLIKGAKVYVFGILASEEESMNAQKIIVKNLSKLSRKNLSLTVPENTSTVGVRSSSQEEAEAFSLWVTLWKGLIFTTVYSAERLEESFTYLQVSSTSFKMIQEGQGEKEARESAILQTHRKYKTII